MAHADSEPSDRGNLRIKHFLIIGGLLVAAGLGTWMGLKPHDWQTWMGFTKYDYFTSGQNYAFYSGIGPMMLTALGMSTIIGGLWHSKNCHFDGCFRIGRHHINGTPWCNVHHEEARHAKTSEQLLQEQNDLLAEQNKLLRQMAGLAA